MPNCMKNIQTLIWNLDCQIWASLETREVSGGPLEIVQTGELDTGWIVGMSVSL